MQYIYNSNCGENSLTLERELYKYIIKVRRFSLNDEVKFRNLKDDYLYTYKINNISKKDVFLTLKNKIKDKKTLKKELEIFWCVIDAKTIEKTLPMLNQIGVKKITFIYCDRSQKNFKLDFQRFRKIVINSNQQCGRVDLMEFDVARDLQKVLKENLDLYVLDFGGKKDISQDIKKVLVGCEGGFSENEREYFTKNQLISFDCDTILKSESAVISISSKLLL